MGEFARSRRSRIALFLLLLVALAPVALARTTTPASASAPNGPIVSTALKYLGTHGGQCWTFMKEVVAEATGRNVGFDYRLGFFEAGAIEVSASEATNGDIIQIASDANTSPSASYPGLHTAIIIDNLGGGVFDAIDSNQNWDEMVNLRPNYDPYARAASYGLQVHIYRIPGGGPDGTPVNAEPVASGDTATVATSCLNLRTSASLAGTKVSCLPAGTTVTVTGGPVDADGYTWVPVSTPSGSGWVASEFLQRSSGSGTTAAAAPEPASQPAPESSSSDLPRLMHVDPSPGCLFVRDNVGTLSNALDCLEPGTPVWLVDDSGYPASGYAWVKVRVEGRVEGWVASEYLVP